MCGREPTFSYPPLIFPFCPAPCRTFFCLDGGTALASKKCWEKEYNLLKLGKISFLNAGAPMGMGLDRREDMSAGVFSR